MGEVDEQTLTSVNATVESLMAEIRAGLHGKATLREQMERFERIAEQYDLAGMHDVARSLRQRNDALIGLRRLEDERTERDAERAARRRRRLRWLTLGLKR